ncbi:Lipoprotein-releasing ABC transporter permease subunit [Candidatus Hepatincolaceae symbiont of Richtersius coronifer]
MINFLFFNSLQWAIAKRYLKSKRKESFIAFISWFALLGIMLGVAVLIIVMSVMNGFRKQIISNLIGVNGHVFIYSDNKIPNYEDTIKNLKEIKEIVNIGPTLSEQVLISFKNLTTGALINGLTYEDLSQRPLIFDSLKKYDLKGFKNNDNVVIVGRVIARNLNIQVGNEITIISPNGYSTIMGSMPRFGSFKVIAILDSKMYQYDSSTIIMPFNLGQSFFNYNNSAQKIDIFLKDSQEAERIKNYIYAKIPNINYVETWQDNNRYLTSALEVERNVMFLILSLVILIAAFNIVSGLIMLVRSKTREIAILRTIGLNRSSIVKIFLLIGIRIGFVGTFLGTLLGTLFSYNIENIRKVLETLLRVNLFSEEIYFLSKLPADINLVQILGIVSLALLFVLISAIYPALKSSKINPVEGLKYE